MHRNVSIFQSISIRNCRRMLLPLVGALCKDIMQFIVNELCVLVFIYVTGSFV